MKKLLFCLLIAIGMVSFVMAASTSNESIASKKVRELSLKIRVEKQRNIEELNRIKDEKKKGHDESKAEEEAIKESKRIEGLEAELKYWEKMQAQEKQQTDPNFQKQREEKAAQRTMERRANNNGY